VVRLVVDATAPGLLGGTLRIVTDRADETVPLTYGGVVIGRETAIRHLDLGPSGQPSQLPAEPAPPGGSR